jgi:hypothetical protein
MVDSLTATIFCDPEGFCSSISTALLPAVPDPPAGSPAAPVEPAVPNLGNEPSDGGADRPVAPEESPAVIGAHPISRNEPSDPAGAESLVPAEPAIAPEDPGPQPEPRSSALARAACSKPGSQWANTPSNVKTTRRNLSLLESTPIEPEGGKNARAHLHAEWTAAAKPGPCPP